MLFKIKPVGKPRMNKSDAWKKRPCVMRYWSFVREIQNIASNTEEYHDLITGSLRIVFVIPMPPSWSEKRRREMDGKPHLQKPDLDNLEKSILDALWPTDDSFVWNIRKTKLWGREGLILVENLPDYSDKAGYDDEYRSLLDNG